MFVCAVVAVQLHVNNLVWYVVIWTYKSVLNEIVKKTPLLRFEHDNSDKHAKLVQTADILDISKHTTEIGRKKKPVALYLVLGTEVRKLRL